MPQLHFSVDLETAQRLAAEAKRRKLTLSKYLAQVVEQAVPRQWPVGYLDDVIGSCRGLGLVEPEELPIDDVEV
ncbi:MAG: hypothetical protein JRI23_04480 [Deltaproteobacteria bacterium]|jgi:hypothetical protein|nr:hypothetical protein [Deltaproteobacteria bacterium]MBW2530800.1 hypothetical protein [Deltaproteobacteria bacterium]